MISPSYWLKNWGPKLRTFARARRRISNWPTAVAMRCRPDWQGLRLLQFRNGLSVVCRGGTQDWEVVSELALNDGYALALGHLEKQPGQPLVLDLGANIGVFSLLAAQRHPAALIQAYEPGPPNIRAFLLNRLANERWAPRLHLHEEAVGGTTRRMEFFYDERNPQASGFSHVGATTSTAFSVQIRALQEILAAFATPVALLKMDIECAEYEVLEHTPNEAWKAVHAISVELHADPKGKYQPKDFLDRMASLGFQTIAQEQMGEACFFLSRNSPAEGPHANRP